MQREHQKNKPESDYALLGAAPMPKSKRDFVNDGQYLAQVTAVKKRRSVNPANLGELMTIIELTIVEVIQHKVYQARDRDGELVEKCSNLPGDLCTQVIKHSWSNSFSKVKGFLAAAMNLSASNMLQLEKDPASWPMLMERAVYVGGEIPEGFEAFDDDPCVPQPLAGARVRVVAKTEPQKKNPKADFTNIEYLADDRGEG